MNTDRENFVQMLKNAGYKQDDTDHPGPEGYVINGDMVIIGEGAGYAGFTGVFQFTAEGKFFRHSLGE